MIPKSSYNSVITTSSSANDYMMVLTTEDFFSGTMIDESYTWSQIATGSLGPNASDNGMIMGPLIDYNEISGMRHNLQGLARLNNTDCAKAYNSDIISDLRNVLLVSNASGVGSILNVFTYTTKTSPVMPWLCGSVLTTNTSCPLQQVTDQVWPMYYSSCLRGTVYLQESGINPQVNQDNETTVIVHYPNDKIQSEGDVPATYNITYESNCSFADALYADSNLTHSYGYTFPIEDSTPTVAYIQYCLAQKAEEQCQVLFSTLVLSIVILCNVLKTVSHITLLLLPNFIPIGTSLFFIFSTVVYIASANFAMPPSINSRSLILTI